MKFLVAVLIVANLLAFAWIRQHERSEAGNGEPEFVAIPAGVLALQLLSEREVEPDVHLAATEPESGTTPGAKSHDSEGEAEPEADAQAEVAAESEIESEAEAAVAAEAETAPQPVSSETLVVKVDPPEPSVPVEVCQTIGPFASEEVLNEGVAWLKERGRQGQVRSEKVKEQTGYWVYLPAMAPELAQRATEDFEAKGVKDYYRGRRNEISLGIYSKEEIAERRRKQIVALGYEPVLAPRFRKRQQYWLDLRETAPEVLTDAEWAEYLVNHPNIAREPADCQ
jgi:hypothetical protein